MHTVALVENTFVNITYIGGSIEMETYCLQ